MTIGPVRKLFGRIGFMGSALDLLAYSVPIHTKGGALAVAERVHLNDASDREGGKFADAFSAHRSASFGRSRSELDTPFETHIQETLDHLVAVHPHTVVIDRDLSSALVEIDRYLGCVGIPRICHDLRQHGWHVAVQIHAQVFERVEADAHFELALFRHLRPPCQALPDDHERNGRSRAQAGRARRCRSFGRRF